MKTVNEQRVLPVYVQHGAPLLIKDLVRKFNREEMHVIACYKQDSDGGKYTILNASFLSLNSINLPSSILDITAFSALIVQIKSHCSLQDCPLVLCADANLGSSGTEFVSEPFHALVQAIQPTVLVPFSETPLCVEDASLYLRGFMTNQGHQLSGFKPLGQASNQKGVSKIIEGVLNSEGGLIDRANEVASAENTLSVKPAPTLSAEKSYSFLTRFFRCSRSSKVHVTDLNTNERTGKDEEIKGESMTHSTSNHSNSTLK